MKKPIKRRKATSRRKRRSVSGNPSLAPAVIAGMGRHKKGVHKRRRRRVKGVGSVTGSDSGDMLLGVVGGIATSIGLSLAVEKFFPVATHPNVPKILAGVKVLAGAVVAVKMKSPLVKGIGVGVAAVGMYDAARDFGIIQGMADFMGAVDGGKKDEMLIEMNGVDINSARLMSGSNQEQPPIIAGEDVYQASASGMPSVVS